MLSGEKGIGKFTMVLHFLTNYFDKKYDLNNFKSQKTYILSAFSKRNFS